MIEKIWNIILLRSMRAKGFIEKLTDIFGAKFTEDMLLILLEGMSLLFLISPKFRKQIKGFNGSYVFKSVDDAFKVSIEFKNERMKVHKGDIANPSLTIAFKDSHALLNFLFSPKPDVIGAMLNQDVILDGNLNYLYRFAYIANHVRLYGYDLL
jgi:hypothetical protein